jgi:3-isopropylmalate dehydrogenase
MQMEVAAATTREAAKLDNLDIEYIPAPMGWNAFDEFGDTLPQKSLDIASAQKPPLLFFGGVGEKRLDKTRGVGANAKFRPEGRCLLTIRATWELLINERPAIYYPELRRLSRVAAVANGEIPIPPEGLRQIWLRYLLEDAYFGNRNFADKVGWQARDLLGMKLKDDVTGDEHLVSNIAYFTRSKLKRYFRYAFARARELQMPLICVAKTNVLPHHVFFWKVAQKIHVEFPDVELREVTYSDDAVQLLFEPEKLAGVIACTNVDGDMLSDGALKAVGSMGLMYSSAINPKTGAAMFESGAGTFPEGVDGSANPIGRVLTGALMLRHICATRGLPASRGTEVIEKAVRLAIQQGYRTPDLFRLGDDPSKRIGTSEMGEKILSLLTA